MNNEQIHFLSKRQFIITDKPRKNVRQLIITDKPRKNVRELIITEKPRKNVRELIITDKPRKNVRELIITDKPRKNVRENRRAMKNEQSRDTGNKQRQRNQYISRVTNSFYMNSNRFDGNAKCIVNKSQ
jgi:hypothetical protein